MKVEHSPADLSEIIGLAWADDVSFDKIKRNKGVSEREVIIIMRRNLKPRSFEIWRGRVSGRKMKHERKSKLLDISQD
jgi:uncharacterized protein (TIGR03643 family)